MKLRLFTSGGVTSNTIIFQGDLTPENIEMEDPRLEPFYYYVYIHDNNYTVESLGQEKYCKIIAITTEDDIPPDSDIIFNINGYPLHVDFNINLKDEDKLFKLTFKEGGIENYPYTVKLDYLGGTL